jgi:hypothetical protein
MALRTSYTVGERVRSFDPRTMGVIREGEILAIGPTWAKIDFGLTGTTKVHLKDIVEPA